MKILLDPGHGGAAPGAVHDPDPRVVGDEVLEKDIALDICLAAGRFLRGYGHDVLYTRDKDTTVPLRRRKELVNQYQPAAFISVHCNASGNRGACGIEAFYRDDRDKSLATVVEKFLVVMTGLRDRGVHQDVARLGKHLTVLDDSECIPATLVEVGFIDCEEDRMYITKNIVTIGEVIADAVNEYCESAL